MMSDFKIIVITTPAIPSLPEEIVTEAGSIMRLLDTGVDLVHIRKPGAPEAAISKLLDLIEPDYRTKIKLHSCPELISYYSLRGLHLPGSTTDAVAGAGALSKSCHSAEEVERIIKSYTVGNTIAPEERYNNDRLKYEYVTLSPIYDSISKEGYGSKFDIHDPGLRSLLSRARQSGTPVIALGGVTPSKFASLRDAGFGGAALLGYVWDGFRLRTDRITDLKL